MLVGLLVSVAYLILTALIKTDHEFVFSVPERAINYYCSFFPWWMHLYGDRCDQMDG
jgi:hypothetical protein